MEFPLVSVIIPSYNHAKFVQETISSVLKQDYPCIELLILDDGSADNTLDVIKELIPTCKKHFARFELNSHVHLGTSATLARLITQSCGKYILALASDDKLLPQCIAEQVKIMEQDSHIVQTLPDNYFIAEDSSRLERHRSKPDIYEPLHTDSRNYTTFAAFWKNQMPEQDFHSEHFHSYSSLLKKHNFLNGSLWRASAIKSFQLPPCCLSEDYFINLQLAKLGRIVFIDKPLCCYRIHSGQTVRNKKILNLNEKNLFVEELKRVCLPGQERWKEIVKQEWFSFQYTRKGISWFYIERRNSYVCSQRVLVIFGHPFVFHTRYKFEIPDWWI